MTYSVGANGEKESSRNKHCKRCLENKKQGVADIRDRCSKNLFYGEHKTEMKIKGLLHLLVMLYRYIG